MHFDDWEPLKNKRLWALYNLNILMNDIIIIYNDISRKFNCGQ